MTVVSLPPRQRRTQADRSAATRARIINATLSILQTEGYAATTIQRIARAAGVSLGALQHHYPTKSQIMATVLRHYAVKRARIYRQALRLKVDPVTRIDAMMDAMWRMVTEGPDFIATVEIELARRSDPELRAATESVLARIDQFMTRWLARTTQPEMHFISLRLINSILLRGMAVEIARGTPVEDMQEAYALWREFSRKELLKIFHDGI